MLTRAGFTLLGAGLALVIAGIAGGNFYYATVALVPLSVFLVGVLLEPPTNVTVEMRPGRVNPRAGEETPVEVTYSATRGAGPLEVHVTLPDVAEVVEGSNLHLAVKPFRRALEGRYQFTVRWPKRGLFELGPVHVDATSPALLRASVQARVAESVQVEVRPSVAPVRRIRGLTGYAKELFPENDQAKTGIRTNEFREIREYRQGDPIKYVNWKATSRLAGFADGTQNPVVNEYEREGKKNVWLFLDAAPYMQFGNTVQNSFELALQAANGVSEFYLSRGYKVGFYVYNHPTESGFLFPDSGRRQRLEIQRTLTSLAPGDAESGGLLGAVDHVRRHLIQDKPLVVVVTRLGKADDRTFQALRKLRTLTGRRRKRIPVLIVSLAVHSALPVEREYDKDVVALLKRHDRPRLAQARRLGARVLEWDAQQAKLEALLVRGGWER